MKRSDTFLGWVQWIVTSSAILLIFISSISPFKDASDFVNVMLFAAMVHVSMLLGRVLVNWF